MYAYFSHVNHKLHQMYMSKIRIILTETKSCQYIHQTPETSLEKDKPTLTQKRAIYLMLSAYKSNTADIILNVKKERGTKLCKLRCKNRQHAS